MVKTQYQIMQAGEPKAPPISLLRISGARNLVTTLDAFGPNTLDGNVAEMQKQYSHPQTGELITLREADTAESILAAAYDFANRAKIKIFNPNWLQAGRIKKASEWVVINPPRDKAGDLITDEETLKSYLNGVKKENGIYRLPNRKIEGVRDCSFVPYESFNQGVQSREDFARSGLARGLEYAKGKKAPKLEIISAESNYPNGVDVFRFDPQEEIKVVGLGSGRGLVGGRLGVCGGWGGDGGYAFGVLESGEASAKKSK